MPVISLENLSVVDLRSKIHCWSPAKPLQITISLHLLPSIIYTTLWIVSPTTACDSLHDDDTWHSQ